MIFFLQTWNDRFKYDVVNITTLLPLSLHDDVQ